MKNTISKEFNFVSLLRFAFPSMVMMLVMGMYTIVDSMFVSRLVGTNALSAINIIYPFINIIMALSIMLASGGSAVIARKMGDGDEKGAREDFSLIVLTGVGIGIVIITIGIVFIKPIIYGLGASDTLYQYCYDYLYVMLLFAPASILQMLFQMFFVTAGRPTLGLVLTILAGVVNVILDYIFIFMMDMGIGGAALATGIGYLIPSVTGVIFFLNKKGTLHFARPKFDIQALLDTCFNGSSEMVTNLSVGVTTFLFNFMMMKYLGEDGVAAITIIIYAQYLMTALFMGFAMGVAPIISYNYGSENTAQLKKVFKICMVFVGVCSVAVFVASVTLSSGIISIFSAKGTHVYEIAMEGFKVFQISFLFAGYNIYASSMFTAFSDGKASAIISFLRTFGFIFVGLLILPELLGVNGIWLSIPMAEMMTLIISVSYISKGKKKYCYA